MVNKYFNYEGIRVWQDGAWDDVVSSIAPLCRWIEGKNKELGKYLVSPDGEGAAKEIFDFKAISKEEGEYWKQRGMNYYACGLGGISLIPVSFRHHETEEPPVILTLVQNNKRSLTRVHDVLTYNKELCEMAANEGYAAFFAPSDGVDISDNYTQVLQEIASIAHMELKKVLLNVSTVFECGMELKKVPNFHLFDKNHQSVEDPDMLVEQIGTLKIPCLDISDIWYERTSQMYCMGHLKRGTNGTMDSDRLTHSQVGKRMAEFMCYEHDIENGRDPKLQECWNRYGLSVEFHEHAFDQWISMVPKGALEHPEEKLPLVIIFQDIPKASVHTPLIAWSQYSGFLTIAGQGDCCLMIFCQEERDDYEILTDVLKEYALLYPVDLNRVYIVGHSHNGGFASAYMRRHPNEIAAIGTLGNREGFVPKSEMGPETMAVEDEEIKRMAQEIDVPTINVVGCSEFMCAYPLYDAESKEVLEQKQRNWNRRLRAYRVKEHTAKELEECRNSNNYVIRKLGFPADWTDCLYMDGTENYIADLKNMDGKYHLRMVAMGNLPHTVSPLMCDLVWSFMRRFAKDPKTGKCIELY